MSCSPCLAVKRARDDSGSQRSVACLVLPGNRPHAGHCFESGRGLEGPDEPPHESRSVEVVLVCTVIGVIPFIGHLWSRVVGRWSRVGGRTLLSIRNGCDRNECRMDASCACLPLRLKTLVS